MNILGIGPGEMVLIATLGLIVFGPQKLPEMAAQLGRMVRDFRQNTADINQEFREAFAFTEIKEATTQVTQALQETATTVNEFTHGSFGPEETTAAPASAPVESNGWHFEGAEATSEAAVAEASKPESFWDWSEAEPVVVAEPPAVVGMWVFDPAPSAPSVTESSAAPTLEVHANGEAPDATNGTVVDAGAVEQEPGAQSSLATTSEAAEPAGVELTNSGPARRDV